MKSHLSVIRLLLNGMLKAIVAGLYGSSLFMLIIIVISAIMSGSFFENLSSSLLSIVLLLLVCGLLALPVSIIGGLTIAWLIYRNEKAGKLTEQKALYLGIIVGSLSTLALCVFISASSYYIGPGHGLKYTSETFRWAIYIYVFYSILATGIAAIAGGIVGKSIFNETRNFLQL